jgi:hypothetical protein
MSIIKKLQDYIEEYDNASPVDMDNIETDILPSSGGHCALAPFGSSLKYKSVTGERTTDYQFLFLCTEQAADEATRVGMYEFLESFKAWIESRDDERDYPELESPYKVDEIDASNAMLYAIDDTGLATYQIQIKLTVIKEVN